MTPPRTGRGSYVWGTASPSSTGTEISRGRSSRSGTSPRSGGTKEALQEANRKLKLLSSITRHDILNQITGLSGCAHLLREGLPGTRPVERYIDRIAELARAIKRQLAFTRDYQEMGVKAPGEAGSSEVVRRAAAASPAEISGGQVRLEVETETVGLRRPDAREGLLQPPGERRPARGGVTESGSPSSRGGRGSGGRGRREGDGEGEGVIVVEDDGLGSPPG